MLLAQEMSRFNRQTEETTIADKMLEHPNRQTKKNEVWNNKALPEYENVRLQDEDNKRRHRASFLTPCGEAAQGKDINKTYFNVSFACSAKTFG